MKMRSIIFLKPPTLDIWRGSEYVSVIGIEVLC